MEREGTKKRRVTKKMYFFAFVSTSCWQPKPVFTQRSLLVPCISVTVTSVRQHVQHALRGKPPPRYLSLPQLFELASTFASFCCPTPSPKAFSSPLQQLGGELRGL